jgi:TatD DNase family protein
MQFIDAHCHLQDRRYRGHGSEIIARGKASGVTAFVCCGAEEADWQVVAQLSGANPEVIASFGVHPWYVAGLSPVWRERLEELLATYPAAAIGEIGLDFAVDGFDRETQERVFRAQLELARQLERPVSIHCRDAWGRLVDILGEQRLPVGGLIHSYSGSADMVPVVERFGLYVSFSGAITRPNARRAQEAIRRVSAQRLLIETDSPDLLPQGAAGDLNEPANLPLVAVRAAALRGMPAEGLASLTSANAERLFRAARRTV